MHSVLGRCWLGGRKGIRPVKKLSGEVLAWSGARCRLAYGPADATVSYGVCVCVRACVRVCNMCIQSLYRHIVNIN